MPIQMKYPSVIERIEQARDVPAKAESYERFQRAFRALLSSWSIAAEQVILVAGTNGKGTVAKTLELMLSADFGVAQEGVGLFTSPHLMSTCERLRSFERDVNEDEFVQLFSHVEVVADSYGLSHFEILTLMACELFFGGRVRKRVRSAIVEVGVGGRLDPTRTIPHAVSVVTRLGLDHQHLLGETLAQIAREKFAIVEANNLLVHAPLPSDGATDVASDGANGGESAVLAKIVQESVQRQNARCLEVTPFPYHVEQENYADGLSEPFWVLETVWGDVRLGLRGRRAVENVSLALHVLSQLKDLQGQPFNISRWLPTLSRLRWPGRMERFEVSGRRLYLSGDHNPQGVESLREILAQFSYEQLWLVVGIAQNKDREAMLTTFAGLPHARLLLTSTPFRAGDFAGYGVWLERADEAMVDPVLALKRALELAGPKDLILCSGSLYLVGSLRQALVQGVFGETRNE